MRLCQCDNSYIMSQSAAHRVIVDMDITKQCTKCKRVFPTEGFRRQSASKDGLQSECKTCMSARAAKRYKNNPMILAKNKEWQRQNKVLHKNASLKYHFSIKAAFARYLGKLLDKVAGRLRESTTELIGRSPADVFQHLIEFSGALPEDFGKVWTIVYSGEAGKGEKLAKEAVKEAVMWRNIKLSVIAAEEPCKLD